MGIKYDVSLTDIHGTEWSLTRGAPGREGLILMGPPNLQSDIDVKEQAPVGQIGARMVGWSAGKMSGDMDLLIQSTKNEALIEVWSLLNRGLSTFTPARLRVRTPQYGVAMCGIVLDGGMPMPKKSPGTPGLQTLEANLKLVSFDGCYRSETHRVTGEAKLNNPGDLPLWPRVEWTGSGAVVTAPGIGAVKLPDTGSKKAVLETDPSTGSRITVDGQDDPVLWRKMRGQFFPLPVQPFSAGDWTFTKCHGVYESLHTNPWRW